MAMLYVFFQGQPSFDSPTWGQMFYQRFDGNTNTWYGIQHVAPSGQPVGMSCAPSPVVWNNGLLQVFHQGSRQDGQLWTTWSKDGVNWAPEPQPVPGVGISFSPATVVFNNKLYVFHPGSYENGALVHGRRWHKLVARSTDLSECRPPSWLGGEKWSYVALTLGSGLEQRTLCLLPAWEAPRVLWL